MSTFRHRYMLTIDGERYEITTAASDHLKAEEAIAREKREIQTSPVLLQMRTNFYAFQRDYPEHPLHRNWQKFVELFDDMDDLEEEEAPDSLDPTQLVDMEP